MDSAAAFKSFNENENDSKVREAQKANIMGTKSGADEDGVCKKTVFFSLE